MSITKIIFAKSTEVVKVRFCNLNEFCKKVANEI